MKEQRYKTFSKDTNTFLFKKIIQNLFVNKLYQPTLCKTSNMILQITTQGAIHLKKNITTEQFAIIDRILKADEEALKDTSGFEGFIERVCKSFGVLREQLFTKIRERGVVQARQLIIYYLLTVLKYTTTQAGAYFGKDHSTAIHCRQLVEDNVYGLLDRFNRVK